MLDRRRFLIGLGGLLTTSFVGEARAFARRTGEPLILPTRKPEETLYIYQQDWSNDAKWRISLGPDEYEAPPAPTWREHLRSLGHRLATKADIKLVCNEVDLFEDPLDMHLDGYGWEDQWEAFNSPQAKAYHLLKKLELGCAPNSKLKQAGQVLFEDHGGHPGSSAHRVELKDDLTVSLLQARLIELNLPIEIVVGEYT